MNKSQSLDFENIQIKVPLGLAKSWLSEKELNGVILWHIFREYDFRTKNHSGKVFFERFHEFYKKLPIYNKSKFYKGLDEGIKRNLFRLIKTTYIKDNKELHGKLIILKSYRKVLEEYNIPEEERNNFAYIPLSSITSVAKFKSLLYAAVLKQYGNIISRKKITDETGINSRQQLRMENRSELIEKSPNYELTDFPVDDPKVLSGLKSISGKYKTAVVDGKKKIVRQLPNTYKSRSKITRKAKLSHPNKASGNICKQKIFCKNYNEAKKISRREVNNSIRDTSISVVSERFFQIGDNIWRKF